VTASLLELHAEALFTHDARGRIGFANEPDGKRAPRYFCARSLDAELWRVRDDVADDEPRPTLADLKADGPAYGFPAALAAPAAGLGVVELGPGDFERVRHFGWERHEYARDFAVRAPFFAILDGERAIAHCFSARLTSRAAEAGVTTHGAYRGRGHGPAVVAAWALAIRATGRTPLYSTSWDNTASQAVARKLGLVHYASDFSLS